jgi:hypothetical protein
MATSNTDTGGTKPTSTTRKTQPRRKPAARKSTTAARKPAAATYATSTQPKTRVEQVQEIAERAVLVPFGATLIVRDDIVSSVRDLST